MPTVNDIYMFLEKKAPKSLKMDFDNVGFLAGFSNREVGRILIALDITDEVISEAIGKGTELIVSHHPLFFELKSVTDSDRTGRKVVRLLSNGVSAVCMHTNLDAAEGGVNDRLAEAIGLKNIGLLAVDGVSPNGVEYGIGRTGELPSEVTMAQFLPSLKQILNSAGLRYHDAGIPVRRVAVVGGSGGGDLPQALAKKCDTFVTADIKYDTFLAAKEEGINLIDADHFCTENLVCEALKSWLNEEFAALSVEISSRHGQTARFI